MFNELKLFTKISNPNNYFPKDDVKTLETEISVSQANTCETVVNDLEKKLEKNIKELKLIGDAIFDLGNEFEKQQNILNDETLDLYCGNSRSELTKLPQKLDFDSVIQIEGTEVFSALIDVQKYCFGKTDGYQKLVSIIDELINNMKKIFSLCFELKDIRSKDPRDFCSAYDSCPNKLSKHRLQYIHVGLDLGSKPCSAGENCNDITAEHFKLFSH